jgi:hypothetical protein
LRRRAIPEIASSDRAVAQQRGDVCVVVRRRDFDSIHADDRKLVADAANRIEEPCCREATWLRRTTAWRMPRVADVDVDGENHAIGVGQRDLEGFVEAFIEAECQLSMTALSSADPARPIDCLIPTRPQAAWKFLAVYPIRGEVTPDQVRCPPRPRPGRVVCLRRRLRRAASPISRISVATVFWLTRQPSSRRSAVIRGDP